MHANNIRVLLTSLALTLAISGAIAGCGNQQQSSSIKSQSYANDGYLGQTNANPHIPGRHMALSYKNDGVLMADAIKNVRGVRSSAVTFNGAQAYIRIKLDPGLSAQDTSRVEKEAASVLRFNFPRYTVHVTSYK
ncbi:hypothetical protein COLU111180_18205 [Cohnella lubricantis]|uniref:Sporulation protein n=1 Tax=Cohnella lubricantis TaxID=2163172 RepID=A0A841TDM0_9BACL|nr:hypothetical protein [Cohnella lubricantis]MBB6679543.1 hypothetical protein [Cohnella lubricantis]MBP2118222.1 hypothetical protein [Cohnella lubricantis]